MRKGERKERREGEKEGKSGLLHDPRDPTRFFMFFDGFSSDFHRIGSI